MKKFLVILLVILIVLGGAYIYITKEFSATANSEEVEVLIPEGIGFSGVANIFENRGVVKNAYYFRLRARQLGVDRNAKPGKYTIPPNTTIDEIFALLEKGVEDEQIRLTIPEGYTIYRIGDLVEEAGIASKDEFVQASEEYFSNHEFDFDTSDLYFNLEGYLYPDTYYFSTRDTASSVVERLVENMNKTLTTEYRERAEELGLSIHEVLTLASLIEREAYNNAERPIIAGVIYNRLDVNMLLQIDATVIYGIGEGKKHTNRVLHEDLEVDNPFNTYKNTKLPPGPIASPGKASIHAALYPEDHDLFYYVMGEDGHVFAKTYDEHQINVQKYRELNQ